MQVQPLPRLFSNGCLRLCCTMACILAVLLTTVGHSDEPTEGELPLFRRVFIPAGQIEEYAALFVGAGGEALRCVPREPEEIERLLKQVQRDHRSDFDQQRLRILNANYTARFDGDQLTDGVGTWELQPPVQLPRLQLVPGAGLPIEKAVWADNPEKEAIFGLRPDGNWGLLVDRASLIRINWSLRGAPNTNGEVHFRLDLPPSPENVLTLEVPENRIPVIATALRDPPSQAEREGYLRWTFHLGGQHQVSLSIATGSPRSQQQPITLVKETFNYSFASSGVELSAKFDLRTIQGERSTFRLLLDPGMRIVAARQDNTPLEWTIQSDVGQRQLLTLQLPRSSPDGHELLTVRALIPLKVNQLWELPLMIPDGAYWQEGTTTLRIPDPFVLQQLEPTQWQGRPTCQQSDSSSLPQASGGETVVVQHAMPEAGLQVYLSRRKSGLTVTSVANLNWTSDQVSANLEADLSSIAGKVFQLEGQVSSNWVIDSVVTQPPETLIDWQLTSQADRSNRLNLQFAKPLHSDRPLRLLIAARLLRPSLGEKLPLADLQPVWFVEAQSGDYYLGLQRQEGFRFTSDLTTNQQINQKIPDEIISRLNAKREFVAHLQSRRNGAQIGLIPEQARYAVQTESLLTFSEEQVTRESLCQVIPEPDHAVDQLRVIMPTGETTWSLLEGPTDTEFTATQEPSNDAMRRDGLAAWLLRFSTPCQTKVILRAEQSSSISDWPRKEPILQFPAAQSHSADLAVRSLCAAELDFRGIGLQQIGTAPASDANLLTEATFRIVNSASGPISPNRYLLVTKRESSCVAQLVFWHLEMESRIHVNGRTEHLATCWIENLGIGDLQIQMPPNAEVSGIWLNSQAIAEEVLDGEIRVALPLEQRFHRLCVTWEEVGEPLKSLDDLTPPDLVLPSNPVGKNWRVWLPHEYEIRHTPAAWRSRPQPSLLERWLGPLGVSASLKHSDLERTAQAAVEEFDKLLAEDSSQLGSWSELLIGVFGGQNVENLLWIDLAAIESLDIQPKAHIDPNNHAIWERLVFVVWQDRLVLTSNSVVATWRRDWRKLSKSRLSLWVAGSESPWQNQESRLILASAWPLQPRHLWMPADATAGFRAPSTLAAFGWSAVDLQPTAEGALSIIRRTTFNSWQWVAGLLGFSAVLWWPLIAWRGLPLLVGCSFIACLFVPLEYAFLSAAWNLGLCGGVAWRLFVSRPNRKQHSAKRRAPQILIPTAAIVFVGLGFCWGLTKTKAEDDERVIYPVFIPVDKSLQPLTGKDGGKYWVPIDFYKQLREQAVRMSGQPKGMLYQRATYQGQITTPPDQKIVSTLNAVLRCHTFEEDVQAAIPFRKSQVAEIPKLILLDDQPRPVQWDSNREELQFPIPSPGSHRVEFEIRPKVEDAQQLFEFDVLPIPTAHLILDSNSMRVDIVSALGQRVPENAYDAELGPVSQILVQKVSQSQTDPPPGHLQVQQLQWLKIAPGSLVLQTRLRCQVTQGTCKQLEIVVDPRFELLRPWQSLELDSQRVQQLPDGKQLHTLAFDRELTGNFVLEGSFLLKDTTGVGRLRLPEIDIREAEYSVRWLALSPDSSLNLDEVFLPTIEPGVFIMNWGAPEPPVQQVLDLDATADQIGHFSVRPKSPSKHVAEHTTIAVFADRLDITYQAKIVSTRGLSFQHDFQLPANFQVQSLTGNAEELVSKLRWRQVEDQLSVRMPTNPSNQLEVRIVGSIVLKQNEIKLPRIRPLATSIEEQRITVTRSRDVTVGMQIPNGWSTDSDDSTGLLTNASLRTVGSWQTQPNPIVDQRPTLRIRPNQPTVQGIGVIRVLPGLGLNELQVELSLERIQGGIIDELQLDVAQLGLPTEISPGWEYQAAENTLSLLPVRSVQGPVRVRLSWLLPSNQTPTIPSIGLVGHPEIAWWLLLPTQQGDQILEWDTQGLHELDRPSDLLSTESQDVSFWQPHSVRYSATLRPSFKEGKQPEIWFADYAILRSDAQSYSGSASFWIDPAGQSSLEFELAPDCKLLLAQTNRHPSLLRSTKKNHFTLKLRSTSEPCFVELVYQWPTNGKWTVPEFIDVPIHQAWWSSYSGGTNAFSQDQRRSTLELSLARWEQSIQAMQRASRSPAKDALASQGRYPLFVERFVTTRDAVQWQTAISADEQQAQDTRSDLIAEESEQAELLAQWLLNPSGDLLAFPSSGIDYWQSRFPPYSVAEARSPGMELSVSNSSTHTGVATSHWILAALIGGISLGITIGLPQAAAQRYFYQWRFAFGVLVGLGWSVWLTPSWIGWLLVILAIWAGLYSGWRPRR